MDWKIPLFKIYSDKEDELSIYKVIKRGSFWAIGPEIEEFEKKIAECIGTKYALTFNSGTSALHTLLLTYNIKEREVIVPSFCFIATANAVILAGGKPVFAETEHETFGLDAEDVEKKITNNTKAILAFHYGGFPSKDIEKLQEIAKKYNLLLIEDAAEAFGAKIKNKKVGCFGDSAIFSLCQNKIFTTGEGGLIVTDSKEIYEKSKLIRSHGRVEMGENFFSSTENEDYIEIGYNFRMPTMLAALGISQLNKVEKLINKRRAISHYFTEKLAEIKEINFLKELPEYFCVYQMFPLILPNEKTRDSLKEFLEKNGIMSKIYFNPIHLKTAYQKMHGYKEGDLPRTEALSKTVLNIPIYPSMTNEEKEFLIKTIINFFKK